MRFVSQYGINFGSIWISMKGVKGNNKRILLVEDDLSIAEMVSLILKDNNYDVTIPANHSQILSNINDTIFDLILLDMSLWGIDGAVIYKDIRGSKKNQTTPVVLMTARSGASSMVDAIGVSGVIEKPFEVKELLKTVNSNI